MPGPGCELRDGSSWPPGGSCSAASGAPATTASAGREIGALLELGAGAAERGLTVAEAAFDLAAGPPAGPGPAPAFAWQCRRCSQYVRD